MLPLGSARAAQIQLTLSGPITSSSHPLFPVSQNFSISLLYDPAQSPQLVSGGQNFYVNTYLGASISSGSYSSAISGPFRQLNILNNFSGGDGYQGSLYQNAANYTFTNPKPNGVNFALIAADEFVTGVIVNIFSSNLSLYSSNAIPTTWNIADYDGTKNFNIGTTTDSFGGNINSISAVVVPEPGALTCLLFGSAFALKTMRLRGRGRVSVVR